MIENLQAYLIQTHLAATWLMTGVIWIVQLVHYPLFSYVDRNRFIEFENKHCFGISWIVMPAMLIEAATGAALYFSTTSLYFQLSLVLLFLCWLSTACLQGLYHNTLSKGFDGEIHSKLVKTNWIRTVSWTLRGLIVLTLI